MSLVVLDPVPLAEQSRETLAGIFNREHDLARDAAAATVLHAIQAGDALLAAKMLTPAGQWTRWLADVFVASPETANVYMRLASCREEVLARDLRSIAQARRWLRELGKVREAHGSHGRGVYVTQATREEACALHAEGRTLTEIAQELGFATSTIHGWVHPETIARHRERQRRSKRRRNLATRALRDQDRAKAIAAKAGPTAEAYSLGRRLGQQLQHAHDEAEDATVRDALARALGAYARLNDAVWEAHQAGSR